MLPITLVILTHKLKTPINNRSIKNYLETVYKYKVLNDRLDWEETIDGIFVTNINWGEKI